MRLAHLNRFAFQAMMRIAFISFLLALSATLNPSQAQQASISIHAEQVLHRITPYLTGACIEDVNHEIYGGIDSQLVFGESFAEPPLPAPLKGFNAYGGRWSPNADGTLESSGGDGPKLVSHGPALEEGQAQVELMFDRADEGNAGLIVKVSQPGNGADRFTGYEVALRPSGSLVLSRHRQNWEPIRNVPCEVPLNQWVTLQVKMRANTLEILVNGARLLEFEDTEHPLIRGVVGLRNWRMNAKFRNLSITLGDQKKDMPFMRASSEESGEGVSGMWRSLRRGSAIGEFAIVEQSPFSGHQSQQLTFTEGTGEIGIENQSLNRWGMNFLKGRNYEGYIWARAEIPTKVFVSLESKDGSTIYSESPLDLSVGGWQRLSFALKPGESDKCGRFAIKLKQPGTITLGYTFLQPGAWGRFKNLPVRKDVANGLANLGITMLRYGGSMVNSPEYRWKKMIGPRERRPPY